MKYNDHTKESIGRKDTSAHERRNTAPTFGMSNLRQGNDTESNLSREGLNMKGPNKSTQYIPETMDEDRNPKKGPQFDNDPCND